MPKFDSCQQPAHAKSGTKEDETFFHFYKSAFTYKRESQHFLLPCPMVRLKRIRNYLEYNYPMSQLGLHVYNNNLDLTGLKLRRNVNFITGEPTSIHKHSLLRENLVIILIQKILSMVENYGK